MLHEETSRLAKELGFYITELNLRHSKKPHHPAKLLNNQHESQPTTSTFTQCLLSVFNNGLHNLICIIAQLLLQNSDQF